MEMAMMAMEHFGLTDHLPFDHSQTAVQLFDQRAARLDPVTIVQIENTIDLAHGGMVDVAAEHSIKAVFKSVLRDCFFKVGDELDRLFYLLLDEARERPIGQAEFAPGKVEPAVEHYSHVVGPAAQVRQPLVIAHDAVKLVAVDDENFQALRAVVCSVQLRTSMSPKTRPS
jgi:hypothetical protein